MATEYRTVSATDNCSVRRQRSHAVGAAGAPAARARATQTHQAQSRAAKHGASKGRGWPLRSPVRCVAQSLAAGRARSGCAEPSPRARAAKGGLRAAAAILALLLAWLGAMPASAQTNCPANDLAGRKQVWSATLTVGTWELAGIVGGYGYVSTQNVGSLSDTSFDIGSNSYTFQAFVEGEPNGQLSVNLSANVPSSEAANLRLHICGETYDFSDATHRSDHAIYEWPTAGLDWSSVTTRAVALSRTPSAPKFARSRDSCFIREHAARGHEVCSAEELRVSDADGDTLTFTLGGSDRAGFEIDGATGRITLGSASSDFETNEATCTSGRTTIEACYDLTVTATDPRGLRARMAIFARVLDGLENYGNTRPPSPPRNLTASDGTADIQLSWDRPTSTGRPATIAGYRVEYCDDLHRLPERLRVGCWDTLTDIGSGTTTAYRDSGLTAGTTPGLTAGTTRYYRVRASNNLRALRAGGEQALSRGSNVASARRIYGPRVDNIAARFEQGALFISLNMTDVRGEDHSYRGTPAAELFTVKVRGATVEIAENIFSSGLSYTIRTAPVSVQNGDRIELHYTDPDPYNDDSKIETGGAWGGPQVLETRDGTDASSFCRTTNFGESLSYDTCASRPATSNATAPESDDTAPAELTAEFVDLPASHDGESDIAFELRFSQPLKSTFSYTAWANILGIAGGSFERAERIVRTGDDRNRRWRIAVSPNSASEDVSILLSPTLDCSGASALCTDAGVPLSTGQGRIVLRTPETSEATQASPLTVAWTTAPPAEHDGSAFEFEFSFSENLASDYGFSTMRDHSLSIRQGGSSLTPYVKRKTPGAGNNQQWVVTVTPSGTGDISIDLPATPDCEASGALCTGDGRGLSAGLPTRVVKGPPGLAVADATVEEAQGATVDFTVTLSRAASAAVTVDYATSDGTATAGSDYTATSGTLAFAVDETEKTVSVPVLDDAHDEGAETFTLTLSNPSGGNAYLADATATGTIENTDAMPRAWLARFGRTVAEQAIEAVEGRFSASRTAGVEMTLAGRRIGASGAGPEAGEEAEARARLEAMKTWLRGTEDADAGGRRAGFDSRPVTPREILTGSSFALTGEAKAGGTVSLWGRGAVSRFDGRDGDLSLDGEVASAMLGADWARDRWTAGLLLSRSVGEGGYRGPEAAGEVASTLTGFFPYGRYAASERVTLWGIAGYGEGELVLTPEGQSAMRTDMDLAMGAVGLRGVAVEAPAEGGVELAIETDAMAVHTTSEKTRGMRAAEADVTRLRLGLEAAWRGLTLGHGHAGAVGRGSGCAMTAATRRPASGSTSAAGLPGRTRRAGSRRSCAGAGC